VISQVIGQVKVGVWPKATTPCAPPERGNVLVAYVLVVMETKTNQTKKTDLVNQTIVKIKIGTMRKKSSKMMMSIVKKKEKSKV
jgi:hypothetical protein